MSKRTLVKSMAFLFVLFAGLAVMLMLNLNGRSKDTLISAVKADHLPTCNGLMGAGECQCAGDNVCGFDNAKCNPFNEFECIRPNETPYDADCRFLNDDSTHCDDSWYNGCNPGAGEICVCRSIQSGVNHSDGFRYGKFDTVSYYDRSDTNGKQYIECGPAVGRGETLPVEQFCAKYPGASFTFQACGNPGKCPGVPNTPTPTSTPTATPTTTPTNTPPPNTGSVSVNASCDVGTVPGGRFDLRIDIPDQPVSFSGNVAIDGGRGTVSGINFPPPSNKVPVNVTATGMPAGITVLRHTCSNRPGGGAAPTFGNGESCEIVFTGCTGPSRTPTPSTTPSTTPSNTPTTTPPPSTPDVSIEKRFVRREGDRITFDIVVRNTGNRDIREFNLSDNYDVGYLEFISASHNGQVVQESSHPTDLNNNRRSIYWNGLPRNGEILTINSTYTLTTTFRLVKYTTNAVEPQNQNCGVVNRITYIDQNGTRHDDTINKQECEVFNYTPENLIVDVNKFHMSNGNQVTRTGEEVRFQVIISNRTNDITYNDVDLVDSYNLNRDRVAGVNSLTIRGARVTKITGTPTSRYTYTSGQQFRDLGVRDGEVVVSSDIYRARIDDLQRFYGNLEPGQSYIVELIYTAGTPTDATCDEVTATVRNNPNNQGSDTAYACAPVQAGTPPKTGASFLLNFILPTLTVAGTVITKKYLLVA